MEVHWRYPTQQNNDSVSFRNIRLLEPHVQRVQMIVHKLNREASIFEQDSGNVMAAVRFSTDDRLLVRKHAVGSTLNSTGFTVIIIINIFFNFLRLLYTSQCEYNIGIFNFLL